jgi:hypothetical protein
MEIDNLREAALQDIFEENFDDLDCEVFECYSCNWVGEECFEQGSDLWEEEEVMLLCPVCGSLIS